MLLSDLHFNMLSLFPGPKIKRNQREQYETTTVHRDLCTVDYFLLHEKQQQQQQNTKERGILQIDTKFLNFFFWSNFWSKLWPNHQIYTFPDYRKL